jgi:hypothetical protein
LAQAVNERIADSPNASVLANVEDLKGLINTIVSNVGEDFIAQIKPKAARLFFVSADDKGTLFYKEKIEERLNERFRTELQAILPGTTFRKNGTWGIHLPNFSRKEGRRVYWKSRIEIELEGGSVAIDDRPEKESPITNLVASIGAHALGSPEPRESPSFLTNYLKSEAFSPGSQWTNLSTFAMVTAPEKRLTTHKGVDIFEVLWSTEVTVSKNLKKPCINDIVHVELNYQPIL